MTSTSRAHWWATLALSGVGALLLAVGLAPRDALAPLPRPVRDENILRIAFVQNLQIDPHRRTFPFPVQNQFILSLWEPLIECDPDTGQPLPAAAESWVWSDDRLTLTLKLRRDGRWSNGEPVKAQDFVRGWRRLLKQSVDHAAVLFPLKNAEAFHRGKLTDPAQLGVEAVDDFTLKLTLAGMRSTWVTELADPLLVPVQADTEEVLRSGSYFQNPEKFVTNGAFALRAASKESFELGVSPHYRDRAHVKLAGARFIRTDDLSMAQLLLAAGKVDMMGPLRDHGRSPSPTTRPTTKASEMALTVTALDLNITHGPLQDLRVRRALSLALDRRAPVKGVDRDGMVPAFSWVPDMPGRPALHLLHEDADEARRLMAEAGYPNGKNFPVLRLPVSSVWRSFPYLQAWTDRWYHELGVSTYLEPAKDEDRMKRFNDGDYDVFLNGLIATVPDAGDMLGTFAMPGVYSASHWEEPKVRELLAEADRKTGNERLAILEQVERIAMDAVPTIPTMFEQRRTLLGGEVEGWYADPLGRQSLKRLWIRPSPPEGVKKAAL